MLPAGGLDTRDELRCPGPPERLPAFQKSLARPVLQGPRRGQLLEQAHLWSPKGSVDLPAVGFQSLAQPGTIHLLAAAPSEQDEQDDRKTAHHTISSCSIWSAIVSGMVVVKGQRAVGLLLAAFLGGCPGHDATRASRPQRPRPRLHVTSLPPILVSARDHMVADARELSLRAHKAFQAGRYLEAAHLFHLLFQLSHDDSDRWTAAFDEAASLEAADRHVQAARRYALAGRLAPDPSQRLQALLGLGRCLLAAGQPARAAAVLRKVLASVHLSPEGVFAAAPLLAQALTARARGQEALPVLRQCLETFRLLGHPVKYRHDVARCVFWQGRVYEARMRRLRSPGQPAQVGHWLLEKARRLDRARRAYLRVLRYDGDRLAYQALHRILALLRHFRLAVLTAPVPRFRPFLYFDAKSHHWKRMNPRRIFARYEQKVRRLLRSSLDGALQMLRQHLEGATNLKPWVRLALERDMARLARAVSELDDLHLKPPPKAAPGRKRTQWKPPVPLPCPFRPQVLGLDAPPLPPNPARFKGKGGPPGR